MTNVRRVIPIVVGWERLPKSYSVHGERSGLVLVEPVPVVLLDTDDGWTLLDSGAQVCRSAPSARRSRTTDLPLSVSPRTRSFVRALHHQDEIDRASVTQEQPRSKHPSQ